MRFAERLKPAHTVLALIILFLIGAMILNPNRYMASVYNGILIFGTQVLPALFPFFFLTKMLSSLGAAEIFGRVLRRPLKLLYNAPPQAGYVFFISAVSGYPVGARLTSDLAENGIITNAEANSMASFTSTSGPIFIIGAVGAAMFQNRFFGYLLLIAHLGGALLNGLLYRNKPAASRGTSPACLSPKRSAEPYPEQCKTDNLLSQIVYDSVISVLLVGGYIALFNMLADVLYDVGVIGFFAAIPAFLFRTAGAPEQLATGIVMGLFEVVRGCLEISVISGAGRLALPITTGLLSFGGASVIIQSVTFLGKNKLSAGKFILMKLTHALFAVALAIPLSFAIQ